MTGGSVLKLYSFGCRLTFEARASFHSIFFPEYVHSRPRIDVIELSAPNSASLIGLPSRMLANRSSCSTWYGSDRGPLYCHVSPAPLMKPLLMSEKPCVPCTCSDTLSQHFSMWLH